MPNGMHHSPGAAEYHQLMATKLISEMSQSIAKALKKAHDGDSSDEDTPEDAFVCGADSC